MKMNKLGVLALIFSGISGLSAFAAVVPVCERTPAVKEFIARQLSKSCEAVNEADLAALKRVAVPNRKITAFKVGDFSGLTNLEVLNIKGNPFTQLPVGLFDGLKAMKTLVMFQTQLAVLPDDFLDGLDNLENIHIFRNPVKTISESVFSRLSKLRFLKVIDIDSTLNPAEKERFKTLFSKQVAVIVH